MPRTASEAGYVCPHCYKIHVPAWAYGGGIVTCETCGEKFLTFTEETTTYHACDLIDGDYNKSDPESK